VSQSPDSFEMGLTGTVASVEESFRVFPAFGKGAT
jgi:hypothetical protein